jgi:hypothetical protein
VLIVGSLVARAVDDHELVDDLAGHDGGNDRSEPE